MPSLWLLVPILMVLGLIGVLAWRPLERLYLGMEKTLNDLMGTEDEAPQEDQNAWLRERLPWGMDVEEVHVHSYDKASYTSLKSLNLRDRTGATVLSIERGRSIVPNPHPDMILLPHDRIILVGRHEQLGNARRYLGSHVQRAEPVVSTEVRIPASSPAVGRALGDLHLDDEKGARVGLVQKADGSLLAPNERVALEPDDHIIVYGPESSIDSTVERLRARRLPDPPQAKRGPSG